MTKWAWPVLAWGVAVATVWGAATELRQQRAWPDATAASGAMPVPAPPQPLTLADYQALQKKTVVSGSVRLHATEGALTVQASALGDYAAWRLTVDRLLLDAPGVRWQVEEVCSGQCPGGLAHQARLTGVRVGAP